MILGISLFGFVAGSLVSYFFDSREKEGEPTLKDVIDRLARLEALVQGSAGDVDPGGPASRCKQTDKT